ncbi:hypothetical protein B9T31_08740 [Acinetobacter sp. ANC 4558]|uniref:SDR family NAD(P)-dependent oxidoreductase n=1 Tax=Acinetobacter sp. ANC 4558 TaxID=1977876 RepID=UPI000A32CD8D|nr:glucose 1-dehydrogenase [Acinetobacter sp. ANC 4558]OTG86117.1 hypothetical protein B9T31_08740 [Acinetobacter sp. ANC 4558]
MGRLQGKVIIVTGGAAGLGKAMAERVHQEGAQVVITDLDIANGQKLADHLGAVFFAHDVTDETRWAQIVDAVVTQFGRIDGLINNAGLSALKGPADPENAIWDDWDKVYKVNMGGVFLGCKYVVKEMARTGGTGSIINMSSIGSLVPTPFLTAYGASKAAVAHFTRSLALHCCEMGYAIRSNSIHPGQVYTPMYDELINRVAREHSVSVEQATELFLAKIPMKKFQEPIDIANAALFLLSDESRYITGSSLVVDGGMTLTN